MAHMQQAEHQIVKHGHGVSGVTATQGAGILMKGYIAAVVQLVFNGPVLTVEGEQAARRGSSRQ